MKKIEAFKSIFKIREFQDNFSKDCGQRQEHLIATRKRSFWEEFPFFKCCQFLSLLKH